MKKTENKKLIEILDKINEYREDIGEILANEEESFANKSEKWQESESGEQAQQLISNLDTLNTHLDYAIGELENIVELD